MISVTYLDSFEVKRDTLAPEKYRLSIGVGSVLEKRPCTSKIIYLHAVLSLSNVTHPIVLRMLSNWMFQH